MLWDWISKGTLTNVINLLDCFALGQGRGVAVLVHRGGNMRMSHEFLLHSQCSGLVQPRTICVTERVKPDPAKSPFQPVGTR